MNTDPILVEKTFESKERLEIEFKHIDLSVVNALRRIVLTDIDSLVIRGFPHKENKINILSNKTKYNNEYLKHRLSCIPIYISNTNNFNKLIQDYVLKINVKNDTTMKMILTTDDIYLYTKDGKKINYKESGKTKKIFEELPIPICYLYPRISENDPYEEFVAEIQFSIGNAKQDACWNMVSKCLFYNTEDKEKIDTLLQSMPEEKRRDFELLDAQRYFIPNHYNFVIETIGVYTNTQIMNKACQCILDTFTLYLEHLPQLDKKERLYIYEHTIEQDKMYIMKLVEDDYTYGKLIEKYMYNYNGALFKFIAFKKEHPHDKHSLIQMVFMEKDEENKQTLIKLLNQIFMKIYDDFKVIQKNF
jgi:hypothetical protein